MMQIQSLFQVEHFETETRSYFYKFDAYPDRTV